MMSDLESLIFPVYIIIWVVLGLGFTLHVWALSDARDKKKWSDRYMIIMGVFVTGTMLALLFLWKNYFLLTPLVAMNAWMIWRGLRGTFYCDSCGKRAFLASPSAPSFFCPSCGHKLK